jgi:hypothetical protein
MENNDPIVARATGPGAISKAALTVSLIGVIVAAFVILVMWLPYYVSGSEGQLFLFPSALLAGALAMAAGAVGCVLGVLAAVRDRHKGLAILAALIGLTVMVGTLPAVWFGNVLT